MVWCWGGWPRPRRPTIEKTIKRNEKARNHAKVKGGREGEGGELRQHYDDARRAHNM